MAQKGHNAVHEYIPKLNLPLSLILDIIVFHSCSILTNIMDHQLPIYLMYSRMWIEQAIGVTKNEVENDKTYLRYDDSIREYFLISFLSPYLYYFIFMLIKVAHLTSEISVRIYCLS